MAAIDYRSARFAAAYHTPAQLPPSTTPEVAFVGRSNVGKSSLLNALFRHKGLARVSSTPGKTATVNFYDVDGITFVDLPGYGFAKVANERRDSYAALIDGYVMGERSHNLIVLLVDSRHPAQPLDLATANVLREAGLPFVVALTKSDKLSKSKQADQRIAIAAQLGIARDDVIVTSAEKGAGLDELRRRIAEACLELG